MYCTPVVDCVGRFKFSVLALPSCTVVSVLCITAAIFYYHAEIVGLFVIKYLNNSLEKFASTGYQEYKR